MTISEGSINGLNNYLSLEIEVEMNDVQKNIAQILVTFLESGRYMDCSITINRGLR